MRPASAGGRAKLLTARGITVTYQGVPAVREVDIDLCGGEITALMGRNGSGKSSLLWALQGSGPRRAGSVAVGEPGGPKAQDPQKVSATAARQLVGLVPQTPTDLLYLESVKQELDQADSESGVAADGTPARAILDRLAPGIPDTTHPRDLSEGQKLALVLAIQLAAAPRVLLLDEPTRGLDYRAKGELIGIEDGLAAEGRAVVISTHDVEFVARAADRVVVMAEGDVVADGPTGEVIVASPVFAPQTAKILAPLPFLTVHGGGAVPLGLSFGSRRARVPRCRTSPRCRRSPGLLPRALGSARAGETPSTPSSALRCTTPDPTP
ncbi:hypothetical protein GCM10009647_067820 [Streptomyces sanglieri]